MPGLSDGSRLGMAMRFRVTVDGIDLGSWTSCTGLSVDFKNKRYTNGGDYSHSMILPDRVDYKPITLRRAMTQQDSAMVQAWLSQAVHSWYGAQQPTSYGGKSAKIELFDAYWGSSGGPPVAHWTLRNVYPSKWAGPDLDAAGSKVAIETLELVHEGFL